MHCNIKAARRRAVVLGFNDSHNASAYKSNTSATSFGYGDPDVLSVSVQLTGGHFNM